jgi:hypothetical protein
MQTMFRAVVMVIVGAVLVKGWMLYGPSNDQVKKTFAQGKELVNSFLESHEGPANNTPPDPRLAAPSVTVENTASPFPAAPPFPASISQAEAPKLLPEGAVAPTIQAPAPGTSALVKPPQTTDSTDRVSDLISHLRQLGAADTNLTPWGGGTMYRFSCRAPLASAPNMTQHFESVAAEPEKAVADVLAKVEAWRVAQRETARRY